MTVHTAPGVITDLKVGSWQKQYPLVVSHPVLCFITSLIICTIIRGCIRGWKLLLLLVMVVVLLLLLVVMMVMEAAVDAAAAAAAAAVDDDDDSQVHRCMYCDT